MEENIEKTADIGEDTTESVEEEVDSSSSVAEDEQEAEAEFTDTEGDEANNIEVKEDKPKQSSKTNAEFAKKRREAEKQKAIDEAREDERVKTCIKYIKTNKYTGEKLEDAYDIAVLDAMEECAARGGDPLEEQSKIHKQVQAKMKADNQSRNKMNKDVADFETKHPDVDLDEVMQDERFKIFAEGKLDSKSLSEVYDAYAKYFKDTPKTNDVEEKREAVKRASVGSAKGQAQTPPNRYYTEKELEEMDTATAYKNFDKVMASMEYHNSKKRR